MKEALKLATDGLERILGSFEKDGKFVRSSMIRNELFNEIHLLLVQAKKALAQPEQVLNEAAIRADEREACANIDFYEILRDICSKAQAQEYSNYVETAIRARGNT